jgi:TatD DNase family protein
VCAPQSGLHPELVQSHSHEMELFHDCLSQTRYVGEVGLDYVTMDEETRLQQRLVLTTVAGRTNSATKS